MLRGGHAILPGVRLDGPLALWVAASSSISFGGTLSNINNASLTKTGDGSVTFTRLSLGTAALNVEAGAAAISPKPGANSVQGTSVIGSLSIAAGASLDLANNALVIDYSTLGSALSDLRAELQDGRLFSGTTTATTSLGYRNNANVASPDGLGLGMLASFGGVAVDVSSLLARVTYSGDTNLDGVAPKRADGVFLNLENPVAGCLRNTNWVYPYIAEFHGLLRHGY